MVEVKRLHGSKRLRKAPPKERQDTTCDIARRAMVTCQVSTYGLEVDVGDLELESGIISTSIRKLMCLM